MEPGQPVVHVDEEYMVWRGHPGTRPARSLLSNMTKVLVPDTWSQDSQLYMLMRSTWSGGDTLKQDQLGHC